MSASKVNPNVWNGEERNGGYIAKNSKPTSAASPDFRGRIYLAGIGWYWLSGWLKDSTAGEILSLRAQEMTDEQAEKFCKPKPGRGGKREGSGHNRETRAPVTNGADATDSDIPF